MATRIRSTFTDPDRIMAAVEDHFSDLYMQDFELQGEAPYLAAAELARTRYRMDQRLHRVLRRMDDAFNQEAWA